MQLQQRFAILSLMQAVLGAVIAVTVLALYLLAPTSLHSGSLTVSIAGLGALAAIYYVSVHQLIKRRWPRVSGIILSLITALNILLVIEATGGLDSPYYALWLLGIVIAGVFGGPATTAVTVITLAFYGLEFSRHQGQSGYLIAHLGQLAISLATAGISEWIHITLGRNSAQHLQVSKLAGELTQEMLKSNVLMESVGEGVLVVDANRQIQLFNPAAVGITGWDEGSAQNIDYRLVLNLHDDKGNKLSDAADPFTEVWQTGKSKVREDLTMQSKSGRNVPISLSLSPIFDSGHRVNGGIALFRDISAEKETERQRNEFISTASHEMRTPVAAIEGYLSLAMNAQAATIDARARGYLEKAHAATEHLGELFKDLLSITKLEDSATVANQEVLDLTKLVSETVSDMQFSAQKKGLELQFGISGETIRSQHSVKPIYAVRGNPQRLREVIMNFIENAIKFTPQGSIHVTLGGTADTATVAVADTGIGIAPEDIPHLFQKFYRIDNSATRTIGGTGLGLYLSRTIIELLGGRIWVESKLDEGSTFRFSLPRVPSDSLTVKTAPKPDSAVVGGPVVATDKPAAGPIATQPVGAPQTPPAAEPTPTPTAPATPAPAPAAPTPAPAPAAAASATASKLNTMAAQLAGADVIIAGADAPDPSAAKPAVTTAAKPGRQLSDLKPGAGHKKTAATK